MAKNLIGDAWVDASNGKVIEVYNPATNELIDTVPDTTKKDCDKAVEAAIKGQKEWERKPIHERASILMKFVKLVEEHKDELAKLLSAETGKPISEAVGEIANVSIGIPAFCEKAKHEYGKVIPAGTEPGQEHHIQYTERYPLGVVVAVIPFNFPSDLFCQKVPPALLMGNSVILKPSAHNPLTLTKYVELLIEAGVPKGTINLLNGAGGEAVQALASNPGVALVTLTGSTIAGAETMAKCAKNITHVTLELGGNDAFILCKDGDVDLAVKEIVWGRLYNTGQVCCASKRFIIHKDVKEKFLNKLVDTFKNIPMKMPSDPEATLGCLISEQAAKNVEKQVNDTVKAGAKLVFGGRRKGAFYEPTILDNVTKDMDVAKDAKEESKEQIFSGEVWCITGSFKNFNPRTKALKEIEKRGGRTVSSVTSKTTHLLAGEGGGSKRAEAERLGVKIVTEDEFMKAIGTEEAKEEGEDGQLFLF